jgi:cellulose biosynthesis protein BcsQ
MEKLSSFIYGNKRAINDEEQVKKRVKISTSNNELNIIPNNDDLLDLELEKSPKLRKSPTKLNLIDKNFNLIDKNNNLTNKNNNLIEYKIVKDNDGNSYKMIWIKFCEDYGFFSKQKV